MFNTGYSQNEEFKIIIQDAYQEVVKETETGEIDEYIKSNLNEYTKNGYLNTVISNTKIERDLMNNRQISLTWRLQDNYRSVIDSVVIVGDTSVNATVKSRIFKGFTKTTANSVALYRVPNILKPYQFLEMSGDPYYTRYSKSNIALVIPVKERFFSSFMGIIGYQPDEGETNRLTGDIQVHIENSFGLASKADLWWYRKDEQSQLLSLMFESPFVWKFNFGGRTHFYQNLQDGLYVQRKIGLAVITNSSKFGKWYIGGEKEEVTATPTGDSLSIQNYSVRFISFENEWDRRDSPFSATHGFYINWQLNVGDYNSTVNDNSMLYRFELNWELLKSLTKRWTLSYFGFNGIAYLTGGKALPESEKFRYGGARTLRGYFEQQFLSDWVILNSVEMRYSTGDVNRFYLFMDQALPDVNSKIPFGYGMGLLQKTPLGLLQLDYAIGRSDKLSDGKIHIRIIGKL